MNLVYYYNIHRQGGTWYTEFHGFYIYMINMLNLLTISMNLIFFFFFFCFPKFHRNLVLHLCTMSWPHELSTYQYVEVTQSFYIRSLLRAKRSRKGGIHERESWWLLCNSMLEWDSSSRNCYGERLSTYLLV